MEKKELTEDQKKERFITILKMMPIGLFYAFGLVPFVISEIWNMFIATQFNTITLSIPHTIGLLLIVGTLINGVRASDKVKNRLINPLMIDFTDLNFKTQLKFFTIRSINYAFIYALSLIVFNYFM